MSMTLTQKPRLATGALLSKWDHPQRQPSNPRQMDKKAWFDKCTYFFKNKRIRLTDFVHPTAPAPPPW
jgi:hypothetical protein